MEPRKHFSHLHSDTLYYFNYLISSFFFFFFSFSTSIPTQTCQSCRDNSVQSPFVLDAWVWGGLPNNSLFCAGKKKKDCVWQKCCHCLSFTDNASPFTLSLTLNLSSSYLPQVIPSLLYSCSSRSGFTLGKWPSGLIFCSTTPSRPLSPSTSVSLCHYTLLWPLEFGAGRRDIFSSRRKQCSTTHRRLVLIKLPLVPLYVLTPSLRPSVTPSPSQGNEARGQPLQNGAKIWI